MAPRGRATQQSREDKQSKATSSLFPIKMTAKLVLDTKHRTITEFHNGSNKKNQQNHYPRTNSRLSSFSHQGPKRTHWYQTVAPDSAAAAKAQKRQARMEAPNHCNAPLQRNNLIKPTHHDETKNRAHDPQTVRAKENPKLSHGRPNHRQAPGTNPPTKALRQSCHRASDSTNCRTTKEETTATNCNQAHNQTTV